MLRLLLLPRAAYYEHRHFLRIAANRVRCDAISSVYYSITFQCKLLSLAAVGATYFNVLLYELSSDFLKLVQYLSVL